MTDDALARIQASINDLTTVENAAIALLGDLANQVRANINDPVALDNLAKQIDAQKQALADAIAANTVAPATTTTTTASATDTSTTTP